MGRLALVFILPLVGFFVPSCSSDDENRKAPRDPNDASTDTSDSGGRGGSNAGSSGSSGSGGGSGSGGSGGTAGTGGSSGSAGTAGTTGGSAGSSAGSGGTGGSTLDASVDSGDAATDSGDASADSGDAATDGAVGDAAACGLGDPCCASSVCSGSYQCLGDRCGCIRAIHGDHYLRSDGRVYDYSGATPLVIEIGTSRLPLENAIEIFEGDQHGCALRNDRSVWCWALTTTGNDAGQLGSGTLAGATVRRQASPVRLAPVDGGGSPLLAGAVHINSGSSRSYLASTTCAILEDSSVWCWGAIANGGGGDFFNDGVTSHRPYAVQILANASTPLTGVSHVGLGRRHACVLRSGEVWCWGANVNGPLGLGNETEQVYPTRVTLPGLAQQIGVGSDSTCARVADAVYCWGSNHVGQLGTGAPTIDPGCSSPCSLLPERVIDATSNPLTGVVDLNVAYHAACVLRTDHSLHCWGAGTTNYASPLNVGSVAQTNVFLHTTRGSSGIPIRLLTRDNVLRRQTVLVTPVCQ